MFFTVVESTGTSKTTIAPDPSSQPASGKSDHSMTISKVVRFYNQSVALCI